MRKLTLGAATALSLFGAGCATITGGISVADVQTDAVAACKFLPDAAAVAALLSADPAVTTAEAIAKIICSAVTGSASAGLRGAAAPVVVVNGQTIPITGHFVTVGAARRQ
jgi:hypothetical protein